MACLNLFLKVIESANLRYFYRNKVHLVFKLVSISKTDFMGTYWRFGIVFVEIFFKFLPNTLFFNPKPLDLIIDVEEETVVPRTVVARSHKEASRASSHQ